MRQYAWYSPDADEIVLQTIVDDCEVAFEWGWESLAKLHVSKAMNDEDPMTLFMWIPLGEL